MPTSAESTTPNPVQNVSYVSSGRIINQFARITQFVTWPLLYIVFKLTLRLKVQGREHLKDLKSPFIIVSNHVSFYDSFLFRLILGFATPHLPLRFMAVNKFDSPCMNFLAKIGFVDFVYALFGVFTVVLKKGLEENLKKPIQIIHNGGNVVVYPEGSIIRTGEIAPFKNGAVFLAQKTGAPVVPIAFRYGKRILFRREFFVQVGAPHTVDQYMPLEQATTALREEVRVLYKS